MLISVSLNNTLGGAHSVGLSQAFLKEIYSLISKKNEIIASTSANAGFELAVFIPISFVIRMAQHIYIEKCVRSKVLYW